jgi:hypothetical protein
LIYGKTAAVLLFYASVTAFAAPSPKLSAEQTSVLEDARAYALQFAEQFPNFICTQMTRREVSQNNHYAMLTATENIITT